VLKRAIRRGGSADQMALLRWLDAGAPMDAPSPSRPPPADKKARRRRKAQP
jgi:hypothetical protein